MVYTWHTSLKKCCVIYVCVCMYSLKVLSLKENIIMDEGGDWLHDLAWNYNLTLKIFDFVVLHLEIMSIINLAILFNNASHYFLFTNA